MNRGYHAAWKLMPRVPMTSRPSLPEAHPLHEARGLARRLLPRSVRAGLRALRNLAGHARDELYLAWARTQGPGARVRFLGYTVRIGDQAGFYMAYKDEFVRHIYHFDWHFDRHLDRRRERPLIIDGGGSIGMSTLYFKHVYPHARVITFEPDPRVFRLLEENVQQNRLSDVRLVQAGLAAARGTVRLVEGGEEASLTGRLSEGSGAGPESREGVQVQVLPLSEFLDEEVDF